MRRKDREVTDPAKIRQIIRSSDCCRLGLWDGSRVYIVPLSFGYEEVKGKRIFYFHSAAEGRKIDLIGEGASVGFELDTHYKLNEAPEAAGYSARFQSVIGTGHIRRVEDPEQKIHALECLMEHYTGKTGWEYPAQLVGETAILMLEVEELACKEHE